MVSSAYMSSIQLLRKSTKWFPALSSYKLILEVISTQSIPKTVFVKQRIKDFAKEKTVDVFAAVATPVQMQDFNEYSPAAGTSYFRDSRVELMLRTPEAIQEIFDSIVYELQKLALDITIIEDMQQDGIYTITADAAQQELVSPILAHYRLPLVPRPAGTNDLTTHPGRQHVGAQNIALPGWLNCTTGDPIGYEFKYNLAADPYVDLLWPPADEKLTYAFVESNGQALTHGDVLLRGAGIFWKRDALGQAPWPPDYIDSTHTGAAENSVLLTLDFVL